MVENYKDIITKYFKEHSFIESNINSFETFIDKELQKIINEVGEVIPTVIPKEVEEYKIKLGKVFVEKPQLTEADGSKRDVLPTEARLRNLTYSAPIYLEVSSYINGVQRESFTTEIGKIPIMLKSKYCHLNGLKEEELISKGEDPLDPGGYFILNGNERVLITVEDLASNKFFIEKKTVGPSKFVGKLFSQGGYYRIPHIIEQMKDGVIYISFARFKRAPIITIIKALGLIKDSEIMYFISDKKEFDDVFINFYHCSNLKSEVDALEQLSKKSGFAQSTEEKIEKVRIELDRYLLPHLGSSPETRILKAYNLCKLIKRFLMTSRENVGIQDKDHYMNKRLKLSGDLLADLFRVNLRVLINDILSNFQRLVKREKFQSLKITIRDQLLTSRIKSSMATGIWSSGRKGISQNMQRTNFLDTLSHLQRVVSLLSSSQENFEARALHPTHWGRLGPIETPEGTPIGLRKNLSLLCNVTQEEISFNKMKKSLASLGLKLVC